MSSNILTQSFNYLSIILDKIQKRYALNLLIVMFIGMIFEILLLNNLVILLNYLTGSGAQTPKIIDYFQNYFNFENLTVLVLVIFIVTFLAKTFINIIVRFKESKFLYKSKAQISERLFVGYLKLPFIFHQRTNSAKILKNITQEIDQFAVFLFSISKLILESMVMIGISLYLIYFDLYTSITCIIAFILFGYFFNFFNKKEINLMGTNRLTHENGRMISLIEGLSGVREIKLSSKDENIITLLQKLILQWP
jgi:ABC-type multidrug transport system fused ATPase/permease subunit